MRHLAVIDAAAALLATVLVATAVTQAAPTRVAPAGLPLAPAWTHEFTGTAPVSAAVSDGGWLVAGFLERLDIFSIRTGESAGSLPLPAARLACNATLCIAGDDGSVRAIDMSRKTVRWQKLSPGALAFAPVLRAGWVFLTTTDGRVVAVREADGEAQWTYAATAPLTGPPSVDGDRIAVATADSAVSLLDLRTGRVLWTAPPVTGRPGAPRLGGGIVYVGTESRDLQILRAADGRVLPPQRTGATVVGAPALDEKRVYTVGQDGVLRAFDRGTGALRWYADLPTRPANAGPIADQGLVFVALRSGAFQVFLADGDGKRPAAVIKAPGLGDNPVLLQLAPIVAGTGPSTTLVTITVNVGDDSKWSASVTALAPVLPVTPQPAVVPGFSLTLTAIR